MFAQYNLLCLCFSFSKVSFGCCVETAITSSAHSKTLQHNDNKIFCDNLLNANDGYCYDIVCRLAVCNDRSCRYAKHSTCVVTAVFLNTACIMRIYLFCVLYCIVRRFGCLHKCINCMLLEYCQTVTMSCHIIGKWFSCILLPTTNLLSIVHCWQYLIIDWCYVGTEDKLVY